MASTASCTNLEVQVQSEKGSIGLVWLHSEFTQSCH